MPSRGRAESPPRRPDAARFSPLRAGPGGLAILLQGAACCQGAQPTLYRPPPLRIQRATVLYPCTLFFYLAPRGPYLPI